MQGGKSEGEWEWQRRQPCGGRSLTSTSRGSKSLDKRTNGRDGHVH